MLRNYHENLSDQNRAEFDADSYIAFNMINMVISVLFYGMLIFNTVETLVISASRFTLSNLPQLSDNDYKHILVMVERCLNFLRITKKHSDFLLAGYAVASGPKYRLFDSGDLRTDNAIIDFKFYSKDPWNRYNSAKLVVDYLLGRYGIDVSGEQWQDVDTLVMFDVRHNRVKYVNVEEYKNEIQQIMQSIQKQIQG